MESSQCRQCFQPVERRGTNRKIEAADGQDDILKGAFQHGEAGVTKALPQEGGKPRIRLDGNKPVGGRC
jgi:hypothetical protein